MFTMHLFYKEGSRPSQVYPWCERANADSGSSNGQTGSALVSEFIQNATCPYCHWEKFKEICLIAPKLSEDQLPSIHFGVHPVFSIDGQSRLLRWEARCGEVKIFPELCLATRNLKEVTCVPCLNL